MSARQAVILVGGKGTRLGDLARTTPKPLLPIDGDTVFLDEVLFNVARHGYDDIVLMAGHLGEQFVDRYDSRRLRGARVSVIVEPEPAGTGGALRHLGERLAPEFLFLNGDTIFDINLRGLDPVLAQSDRALAALALRRVPDPARYGSVRLEDERIVAFHEKSAALSGAAGCINAGVGLFRREILDYVERLPCSIEMDVHPRLASDGRLIGREFAGYFIDIGLPDTLRQARDELPKRRARPTVFFDRDGVLNHDVVYTHKTKDLRWIDGAVETVRRVNDLGALAIVVSNQAGVARGYYGTADVDAFHAAMQQELARHGAHIDAFCVSPHHPEATLDEWRHPDPPDRKPNPGMILRAMADWPVDKANSLLIGDKESDLQAARRAGIDGLLFAGGNLAEFADVALSRLVRE